MVFWFEVEKLTGRHHPRLWCERTQPIFDGRNPSEIFLDMLFAKEAGGNNTGVRVGDGCSEEPLHEEDPLRMMPQRTVAEVGKERLRLIKPLMDGKVVLGRSSILRGTRQGVVIRVHRFQVSSSYSVASTRQLCSRVRQRLSTLRTTLPNAPSLFSQPSGNRHSVAAVISSW